MYVYTIMGAEGEREPALMGVMCLENSGVTLELRPCLEKDLRLGINVTLTELTERTRTQPFVNVSKKEKHSCTFSK